MTSKSQQQSNGCGCLLGLITFGLIIVTILPSFFYTNNPHREVEPKQYVGSMNRQQQAYFLEKNTFSNDIEKLDLGIKTETTNYSYSTEVTDKAAFNYGVVHSDKYAGVADSNKYTYRTK
ncbi:MAG TPA: hypothetical protein DD000_01105, partial [Cyanobacteria bacterium UBA11166]|nr:hypothetical protein [Cyanobacteria bacterium UBA11166]